MIAIKIFVFLLVFISNVYSSCMFGHLTSEISKFGLLNQYCTYNDLKILPGASFRLAAPECLECKCGSRGLRCCGYGFAAGVAIPPPGCERFNDACRLIFVKKENISELCNDLYINNKNKKSFINHQTKLN